MDAAAELGRNLVSKHQIQPECGDEQADAGRNCRTRLAIQNSQARTRMFCYFGEENLQVIDLKDLKIKTDP